MLTTLQTVPARRYQTADAMAADLRYYRGGRPIGTRLLSLGAWRDVPRQKRLGEAEALLRESVALRRSYLDSPATVRLGDEGQWGDVLARPAMRPSFRAPGHGERNPLYAPCAAV